MPRADRCDNCPRKAALAFGVAEEGVEYLDAQGNEIDGLVMLACSRACKRELLLEEVTKYVGSGEQLRRVRPTKVPPSLAVWDEDLDEVRGTA